jgi:hypothetical protein
MRGASVILVALNTGFHWHDAFQQQAAARIARDVGSADLPVKAVMNKMKCLLY